MKTNELNIGAVLRNNSLRLHFDYPAGTHTPHLRIWTECALCVLSVRRSKLTWPYLRIAWNSSAWDCAKNWASVARIKRQRPDQVNTWRQFEVYTLLSFGLRIEILHRGGLRILGLP